MKLVLGLPSYLLLGVVAIFGSPGCESPTAEWTVGIVHLDRHMSGLADMVERDLTDVVVDHPLVIRRHDARGDPRSVETATAAMVKQGVDLIIAISTPVAQIVQRQVDGSDVAVVFSLVNDPKAAGLVDTLAQPGGQITGVMSGGAVLAAKALERLVRADSSTRRILLVHSDEVAFNRSVGRYIAAAETLGVELTLVGVHSTAEAAAVFGEVQRGEYDAGLVPLDRTILGAAPALEQLTRRTGIPLMSFTLQGGFATMSFGADRAGIANQTAIVAARVLAGSRPAAFPVEVPQHFSFAIDLDRARRIGYQVTTEARALADVIISDQVAVPQRNR